MTAEAKWKESWTQTMQDSHNKRKNEMRSTKEEANPGDVIAEEEEEEEEEDALTENKNPELPW
mgnify:CR=1 FL=1